MDLIIEKHPENDDDLKPMPKNEIKGKLALSQVMKSVKKFARHRGGYASVNITIHYNPKYNMGGVNFKVWDSTCSTHFEPIGPHNDIRKIGALIEQLIRKDEEHEIS